MPSEEEFLLGEIAYNGYRGYARNRSIVGGYRFPEWIDLVWPLKEAWIESALAVKSAIIHRKKGISHEIPR